VFLRRALAPLAERSSKAAVLYRIDTSNSSGRQVRGVCFCWAGLEGAASYQLPATSYQLEAGSWKLEAGSRTLEAPS